jgi:hypothetical protein
MSESGKPTLLNDKDALLAKVESLKKQIYLLQMELDILNKAAEIIKKDPGNRSPEASEQGESQPVHPIESDGVPETLMLFDVSTVTTCVPLSLCPNSKLAFYWQNRSLPLQTCTPHKAV